MVLFFSVFASLPSVFFFFRFFRLLFAYSFFSFSVFVYARANIIMCLSFFFFFLRYKNLLCNASVIQCITKKFQGIRIICLVKVCLLALKGLLLHPQSREMRWWHDERGGEEPWKIETEGWGWKIQANILKSFRKKLPKK